MKIVFITNFVSFHEIDFWESFCQNDKKMSFVFLKTDDIPQERIVMGYNEKGSSFVLDSRSLSSRELDLLFADCDFAIVGSCCDKRVYASSKKAKRIVMCCEHIMKNGFLHNAYTFLRLVMKTKRRYRRNQRLLLCRSSFVAKELKKPLINTGVCAKFGYFPKLDVLKCCNDKYSLLWSGRFLSWKHPEMAIMSLLELSKQDDKYHLTMVGSGPKKERIIKMADKLGLKDKVEFLPFLSHDDLMVKMSKSGLLLMSSDHHEGWGAVTNEAMANGVVVLSSIQVGSAAYLIEDGQNGLLFSGKGNFKKKLAEYASLSEEQEFAIREKSKSTVFGLWDYNIASRRLYLFLKSIEETGKPLYFEEGPLSEAS